MVSKECGHQMNTKAAVCPNCGARRPRRFRKALWIVGGTVGTLILIPIIIGIILAAEGPSSSAPSRNSLPAASVLYKRVQTRIASEKWQSALVVARTLIRDYPKSKEAGLVKARLPTLKEKAAQQEAEQKAVAKARESQTKSRAKSQNRLHRLRC